jgi:hypothetical protein
MGFLGFMFHVHDFTVGNCQLLIFGFRVQVVNIVTSFQQALREEVRDGNEVAT